MANNITVKDANSVNQVVKTTEALGVHTHHHNVDSLPPLPVGANHIGQVSLDATATVQDGGGSLSVDDNGGSLTVDNAALSVVGGGVQATAQRVTIASDSTGVIGVTDNGGSLTIDGNISIIGQIPAGANNIGDVDVASFAAGALVEVQGDVAHDSAVGGNPVLLGAEARTTDGTAVASGDAVRVLADTLGKQVVLQGAVHDLQQNGTANFTTTTAADVIAAGGAGVRIAVTSVLVTNAHATVGTKVSIRDGSTAKITAFAAAAGGGFSLNAGGRPLFITTANTAVQAVCATTGADVDVSVSGYKIGN